MTYHDGLGYCRVIAPGHPRADRDGHALAHILVAEQALGHVLPPQAVVHHRDENPGNNAPENLVICEDQAYHMRLHWRLRAYRACGHADWRWCRHCDTWDAPERLYRNRQAHPACYAVSRRTLPSRQPEYLRQRKEAVT